MKLKVKYILIILIIAFSISGCTSESLPSGLEDLYIQSQSVVKDALLSPATAVFPEFDESFVKYRQNVLADLGEGVELEYRVYDVKAYVDSQNMFGALVRAYYWVTIYSYVDDYNSPQFGEKGIHKGIDDHYYICLEELG